MNHLGKIVGVVGVLVVFYALSIDVSILVEDGAPVDNLSLASDRHVYTIVGGVVILAGLLMVLHQTAPASHLSSATFDSHPCPLCTEPVRNAALRCRHCGADLHTHGRKNLTHSERWEVFIACEPWAYMDLTRSVKRIGLTTVSGLPNMVIVGPFDSELDADIARESLKKFCGLGGELNRLQRHA